MKVSGKVHFIGQTKVVSDKFKSRELVLKTEDKFPQFIPFQLTQDKVDLADNLKVGEDVEASINIRGREWKSPQGEIKYFATLEIWSLQLTNKVSGSGYVAENQINEKDDMPW
jgi:single-strand DNA-binding protein